VPLGTREQVVQRVREILAELVANPGRAAELGERARQRVYRHFTWAVKARQILEVYRWVLGEGARPDFGMPFPDDAEPVVGSTGS
jgi:glycosyltransferase involved in cell wall biosynthesis